MRNLARLRYQGALHPQLLFRMRGGRSDERVGLRDQHQSVQGAAQNADGLGHRSLRRREHGGSAGGSLRAGRRRSHYARRFARLRLHQSGAVFRRNQPGLLRRDCGRRRGRKTPGPRPGERPLITRRRNSVMIQAAALQIDAASYFGRRGFLDMKNAKTNPQRASRAVVPRRTSKGGQSSAQKLQKQTLWTSKTNPLERPAIESLRSQNRKTNPLYRGK